MILKAKDTKTLKRKRKSLKIRSQMKELREVVPIKWKLRMDVSPKQSEPLQGKQGPISAEYKTHHQQSPPGM